MSEELLEAPVPRRQRGPLYRYRFILILGLASILLGVYVGNLLFGANSIEVLWALADEERRLNADVASLKNENAHLQKAYFEQQQLQGNQP